MEKRSAEFEEHIDKVVQKNAAAIERQKRAEAQKKKPAIPKGMEGYLAEDDDATTVARGFVLDKLAEEAKAHYERNSDDEDDDADTIASDDAFADDPLLYGGVGGGPVWDHTIVEEYDDEEHDEDDEDEDEHEEADEDEGGDAAMRKPNGNFKLENGDTERGFQRKGIFDCRN